jgi:hypothetical protein
MLEVQESTVKKVCGQVGPRKEGRETAESSQVQTFESKPLGPSRGQGLFEKNFLEEL